MELNFQEMDFDVHSSDLVVKGNENKNDNT